MGTPRVIVGGNSYNSQLLYFTSSSLSADNRYLYFICDKTGSPNVFALDLIDGTETMLSNNTGGYMKSYVYFDGDIGKGFGKASVSLDQDRGIIYYIQDNLIVYSSLTGEPKVLAEIPENQVTAFTHISADGTRLCIPTTDARALEYDEIYNNKPPYNIDERVQNERLNSYIRVYDTNTGKQCICEPVPNAWITHVQFSPHDNDIILYNHEWPSFDCGIRRMWLFDGKRHTPLRSISKGRSRNDWTCHEMWSRDGKYIIYHGRYGISNRLCGFQYIGRVSVDTQEIIELPLPIHYRGYGHFILFNSNTLVSDGYYRKYLKGGFISVQHIDWDRRTIKWIPLCKHRSSLNSQDAHPHPIFNNKGDAIYFTSDMTGSLKIYRVNI